MVTAALLSQRSSPRESARPYCHAQGSEIPLTKPCVHSRIWSQALSAVSTETSSGKLIAFLVVCHSVSVASSLPGYHVLCFGLPCPHI